MNHVIFSVETNVVRNTLEYIFIGKDDYTFHTEEGIRKGFSWVKDDLSMVVCECKLAEPSELNSSIMKINVLRKQLNEKIPLILFCENPELLKGKLCSDHGNIRIVALDHFFLDNLFEVMQEEFFSESLACCYSM